MRLRSSRRLAGAIWGRAYKHEGSVRLGTTARGTWDWPAWAGRPNVPVPVSGGRCRPAAGAGCAAFGLPVSPCSKAVRCSSPTPWDAAFSWRPGMGRASPGRFAPGPARSSTHGAQVRGPVLLAFHPRSSLPPTSDPETCEPDLSSVTMSRDLSSWQDP